MVFKETRSEYVPYYETDMGGVVYRSGFYVGEQEIQSHNEGTSSAPQKNYLYYVYESQIKDTLENNLNYTIRECDDLKALRALVLLKVNLKYNKICEQELMKNVPLSEVQTWTIQKQEAETYETTRKAPFLENLSKIRGIELTELIQKVKEKNAIYINVISVLTGVRQKIEDKIVVCESLDELRAIDFTLPEAQLPSVNVSPLEVSLTRNGKQKLTIELTNGATDYEVTEKRSDIVTFAKAKKELTAKTIETENDSFYDLIVITPKNGEVKGTPVTVKVKVKG